MEILDLVAQRRGVDFRDYRRDTLSRRVQLRVRATHCDDLLSYRERLGKDPAEMERLVAALLVPVTGFFRDAWVFNELARHVLPALLDRKNFLQAWVVGAATGEEAYTLAMLLTHVSGQRRGMGFEVVASDIDRRALEVARAGVYAAAATADIPVEMRERYVRIEGPRATIAPSVRNRVRFAEHDLNGPHLAPAEAIVASFDLVLCRNVLLYFEDSLRATAVERFAALLEPHGALVIGTSESLPARAASLFEPSAGIAAGAGIFRRRRP